MRPEQSIAALVDGVQLSMDDQGRFWRLARRSRTGRLVPCQPVRAEHLIQKGYYHVRANIAGRMVCAFAHRLVWLLNRGPIPEDLQINHLNGNKTDNRVENLELCTAKQNTQHAIGAGLAPRVSGERHPRARFTTDQIVSIRERRANGEKLVALAAEFGVSHQAIVAICRKETWRHV